MSFFKTYAWDIPSLSEDLLKGEVSQSYRMKAFLALLVMVYLAPDLVAFAPELPASPPQGPAAVALVVRTLIVFGGTLACFRVNARVDAKEFVDRFVCFSLPVILRVLLLSLPLSFAASVLKANYFKPVTPDAYSVVDTALDLFLDLLWFGGVWRCFRKLGLVRA